MDSFGKEQQRKASAAAAIERRREGHKTLNLTLPPPILCDATTTTMAIRGRTMCHAGRRRTL